MEWAFNKGSSCFMSTWVLLLLTCNIDEIVRNLSQDISTDPTEVACIVYLLVQ
jgi:hypothetical protein